MRRPSASIAAHWSSVYGFVTRGVSPIRVTDMWNSKPSSTLSSSSRWVNENEPVTGAADCGSAVQASGMCPSAASSPEVGSRPIQPAPGR